MSEADLYRTVIDGDIPPTRHRDYVASMVKH